MTTLKRGDIIWAKLRGYPWWPAHFVGLQGHKLEPLVKVKFINDNSHAFVGISQVVAYKDKREEYGKTKRKTLMRSIHCADKLITSSSNINSATECKIEGKEFTGKRKLIISDSEEELVDRDVEKLLEQVTSEKNLDLAISLEAELLHAIKSIKREVTIITKEIEESLEEFINLYSGIPSLKKICYKATELLKNMESASTREENQEMSTIIPHKLKRLKRSESMESEDSIEEEELILFKEGIPKNMGLMITVCQELAKIIEEVKKECNE